MDVISQMENMSISQYPLEYGIWRPSQQAYMPISHLSQVEVDDEIYITYQDLRKVSPMPPLSQKTVLFARVVQTRYADRGVEVCVPLYANTPIGVFIGMPAQDTNDYIMNGIDPTVQPDAHTNKKLFQGVVYPNICAGLFNDPRGGPFNKANCSIGQDMVVRTERPIDIGEELTISYGVEYWNSRPHMDPCLTVKYLYRRCGETKYIEEGDGIEIFTEGINSRYYIINEVEDDTSPFQIEVNIMQPGIPNTEKKIFLSYTMFPFNEYTMNALSGKAWIFSRDTLVVDKNDEMVIQHPCWVRSWLRQRAKYQANGDKNT